MTPTATSQPLVRIPLAGECTVCGQPAKELRIYKAARVVDHAQPGTAGRVVAAVPPCPLPNPPAPQRSTHIPLRPGRHAGVTRKAHAA